MNTLDILKQVWSLVWKQVLVTLTIITLVAFIRPENPTWYNSLIVFNLCTLIPVLVYKLFSEKPTLFAWAKAIGYTILASSLFALVIGLTGFFGLFGVAAALLVLAAYRIYSSWALFDYTTSWGAAVLKGKATEFDLSNVGGLKDGGLSGSESEADAQRQTEPRGATASVGESQELTGGSQVNEEVVQVVSRLSHDDSYEGKEVRPSDVVREVSASVRKSNPLRRKKRRVVVRKVELKQEVD